MWFIHIAFEMPSDSADSWGTKEGFRLTLAPESPTTEFYMVEKVIRQIYLLASIPIFLSKMVLCM